MKKIMMVIAVALMMATAAMAGQVQVGYSGSGYGPYQTGIGGEFTLTPTTAWLDLSSYASVAKDQGTQGSFQTFCVDGKDVIYPYASVYDASVSTLAARGSSMSPISVGVGWLYSQFASNNWDATYNLSYNYGAGRSGSQGSSADLLQKAIWWLEGQENIGFDAGNMYMAAVKARFGSEAGAKTPGAEQFGVYAFNITGANGVVGQTQLYYHVPDGGATVLLLGFGLAGLTFLSRRFRD
jgi:hypothetical protein